VKKIEQEGAGGGTHTEGISCDRKENQETTDKVAKGKRIRKVGMDRGAFLLRCNGVGGRQQ